MMTPVLVWKAMAAIIREEKAGGWVKRDHKNKEKCCLGTVLGADLGKTGPGAMGVVLLTGIRVTQYPKGALHFV